MKKRRYPEFACRPSITTERDDRRPYSGRVSGSDQTENQANRETDTPRYYDGDRDRQPSSQAHLSGGLRSCDSPSAKFQWNNLLAQNPDPDRDPSTVAGSTRPVCNCSSGGDTCRLAYGLGVDKSLQYGQSHHGGFTSPLGKNRSIPYSSSMSEGFLGISHECKRSSRAMAEGPVGLAGYSQGQTPRHGDLVGHGCSSVLFSEGFRAVSDEFNRSRAVVEGPIGNAGYSKGSPILFNEGFGAVSESRAVAEGFIGNAGYSQEHKSSPVGLNGGIRPGFSDGYNISSAKTESHGVYSQTHTLRHNHEVSAVALNEGFCGRSDDLDRSRAMDEGHARHTPIHENGGPPKTMNEGFCGAFDEFDRSKAMVQFQGHTPRHENAGPPNAMNEVFNGDFDEFDRSRAMTQFHGHTRRHEYGGPTNAMNEGFRGDSDEFDRSRAMAEPPINHGQYSYGQTPRVNESVDPKWTQQSPNRDGIEDYKIPGMKRNEKGGDVNALLLDIFYKKVASVGEDTRPPTDLRPCVIDRVDGINGFVRAGTLDICQLNHHPNSREPTQVYHAYPSTSDTLMPFCEEVMGSSNSIREGCWNNGNQGLRMGVDDGYEREVQPLSYESNLDGLALVDEEDQGLLEAYGGCQERLAAAEYLASISPVGRWHLRKVAMKEFKSGNHSKSKFFPDLNPSCDALNSSYEANMHLTAEDMQQQYVNEEVQQFTTICGEAQYVSSGLNQRNIGEAVTCGEDQYKIHRGVIFEGDQCNNDQCVTTCGEQQWCLNYGGVQWNNEQAVAIIRDQQWHMNYGEDQHMEHTKNQNCDSLSPASKIPASMQDRFGEQSKNTRIPVKERLGLPKLSSGSIKKRLGPQMKPSGTVKMHSGPAPKDHNHSAVISCKTQQQHKCPMRKTNDFYGPLGAGPLKDTTDAATESIHPLVSARPLVLTDDSTGFIHPQEGGLSKVKKDVTGSIHPQGNAVPNSNSVDCCGTICGQGGNPSKVEVKSAKKESSEESKEFKQLVNDAFLKFVKILVENKSRRKQFMEGKGGKCFVCFRLQLNFKQNFMPVLYKSPTEVLAELYACTSTLTTGGNLKEFTTTVALAMHAFMSPKVGSRAEHLGFHRALCVLLGWNSAAVSNGMWVQQILPGGEATGLKEDLVIWPPVVVIHYTLSSNENSENEKLTVKGEDLEDLLTGMGFVGGKIVYCGTPADQTLMYKFKPTYTGLQEAERLHTFFVHNKHGKVEWQLISSLALRNGSDGKQALEVDEVIFPYGYLGCADDWGELDLGTTKHFSVRSLKQMKATHASL